MVLRKSSKKLSFFIIRKKYCEKYFFTYSTAHVSLEVRFHLKLLTANLTFNLAKLYIGIKKNEDASELLLDALKIYKKEYGEESLELIETYLALGASAAHKKSINYYAIALDIAQEHEDENPLLNAQVQLDAGQGLLLKGDRKSRILLTAQKYFSEHLPSNDRRVVYTNFHVGKYYLARKKYNSAITNLEANLPVFETLDGPTHPLELSTHAFLINALEHKGRSDEATKHCIAIGSMVPWNDSQEQTPLFRASPKYPMNLARRGRSGYVIIEFTISDYGTVTHSKILDSKGGPGFEKEALVALAQWRYAPKFENGKPVETKASVQLDFKIN